jgi:uncharacterized protein YndB with AHSA1/START domain
MPKSARAGQVSLHMDAPPEKVWDLLADVERMGDWSPECYRVEWLEGAASPAKVGARFKGWNRSGRMKWSMTCKVSDADPGRKVSWTTLFGPREGVRWTYSLEPAEGGTDVTESFEVLHLSLLGILAEDFLMRNRDQERERGMRTTLERIKTVVEGGRGSSSAS